MELILVVLKSTANFNSMSTLNFYGNIATVHSEQHRNEYYKIISSIPVIYLMAEG